MIALLASKNANDYRYRLQWHPNSEGQGSYK